MALIVILILVGIVIALMVYNMSIHNKVKTFTGINQKINSLNVLQDFMNAVGEETSVENKISRVNEILLERFEIKYSSIIAFDGAEYSIKATNVDEKHHETLKNMHTEDVFKQSIANASPKYITIEGDDEKLPYQQSEFGRAKSAMFFPLYIDSVYIGYWLIESGEKHAFDGLDTAILEVVKDNIVAILRTVNYQSTMENIDRTDQFTQLQSAEYLYGKGKKIIDKHVISTVLMFKITNLPQINDEFGRLTGNKVVTEVSRAIKPSLSNNYVFVRYMGPKFVIVFAGVEQDAVFPFVKDVKKYVEKLKVPKVQSSVGTKKKTKKQEKEEFAVPKINCVMSTYYKGTALDGITKKLEEYLDSADIKENEINYI